MFIRKSLQAAVLLVLYIASSASFGQAYEELLKAVEDGHTKSVERLLDRGLDPNTADPKGNTILMMASRLGHRELVALLIRRKASVTKRSPFGDTALMMASLRGDLEIARLLVENGAEVSHRGWAPIHYAAFENRAEIIGYLIAKGADKDALAPNGYSALMLAARGGHLEAAKTLLYEDAEVRVKGPKGETALSIAKQRGMTDFVELLKRAGAVE